MLHCSNICGIASIPYHHRKPSYEENNMTINENAFCPTEFAAQYTKSLERTIELSKSTLDQAVKQNAEILASTKNALKGSSLPGLFVLDLAGEAVEGFVAVQKSLLDLALDQSNASIAAVQSFGKDTAKADFSNVLQASFDRAIAAQNLVVEFAVKQTKTNIEAVKAQPGVAGTVVETAADSVQKGFDTVVAAQKEITTQATKSVKAAAAKA
jgi:hypothetical protein